jgi:hypothetical protein
MLAPHIADIARDFAGEPTGRSGDTLRYRSRGSLAVVVRGARRGLWYDHEAGKGGDALDLLRLHHGGSLGDAIQRARIWLGGTANDDMPRIRTGRATGESGAGVAPNQPGSTNRAVRTLECNDGASRPPPTLELARRLWREAQPAEGTLIESYLGSRGLRLEPAAPFRFHPAVWRNSASGPAGPAMLALMTAAETAKPVGVHVTYLRDDGAGKAAGDRSKVMLGKAGIVRLVPDADVTLGLGFGEGIETSLSLMQRAHWRPVWAATSAGGFARFPPLPGIAALTIFVDADDNGASVTAALACAERWRAAGHEVRIVKPPTGTDWDDALKAWAG